MKFVRLKVMNTLSKDEINALPLRRFTGPIRLVETHEELNFAVTTLRKESVLGFDTETRPTFKKGQSNLPALLQLAGSKQTFLFRLHSVGLNNGLLHLLETPEIVKAGVAVHDDILELQRLTDFTEAGFIDLGTTALEKGFERSGLRNLTASLLGYRISKSAQCSNWEARPLTKRQIDYAATDAWVSRELYLKMHDLGLV